MVVRGLDTFLERFLQGQGNTNACGTTSLSAILSYWAHVPGAYSHQQLDADLRLGDSPTFPTSIVPFLERNGFRASLRNQAAVADLKAMIDQGVPVQVLIDTGKDDDLYLHYVAVVDYTTDANGEITGIVTADSNLNGGTGGRREYPLSEFQAMWDGLKLNGMSTGLSNVMITALPKESVPVKGKDGRVRQTDAIELPEPHPVGWQSRVAGAFWGLGLAGRSGGRSVFNTLIAGVQEVGRLFNRIFQRPEGSGGGSVGSGAR